MFERISYFFKNLLKPAFKVGIVSYYYPQKNKIDNGVAVHTYYLSRKLAEKGCEVHVFCYGDKSSLKEEYLGEGKFVIHFISLNLKTDSRDSIVNKRMRYFMFDNRVINEINRENNHHRFDIIHTHGWLTAGAFISRYLNNIKWVHTFHALEKNRLKFMTADEKKFFDITKWIESTVNYADAIISVSKKLKEEISQAYDIEENYVYYIPNGVDLSLFNAEGNQENRDGNICFIGRLSLEKGADILVNIASKVLHKNPNAKFTIVSYNNSKLPSLEKTVGRFKMLSEKFGDRFSWISEPVGREDISEIYKKSVITIQPSRYEAFGLAALEGMACGSCVICSDKGGLPEVVDDGGIVLPLNINAFSKKILELLDDYRLRERYARRGLKRAKEFSWDSVADKTFELYRVIAKNKTYPISEEIKESPELKTNLIF